MDLIHLDLAAHGLVIWQPDGRRTLGTPPVMVQPEAHCGECGEVHDIEACPRCGSWIGLSYGLMFGGMGLVKFCDAGCGWFYKIFEDDDE